MRIYKNPYKFSTCDSFLFETPSFSEKGLFLVSDGSVKKKDVLPGFLEVFECDSEQVPILREILFLSKFIHSLKENQENKININNCLFSLSKKLHDLESSSSFLSEKDVSNCVLNCDGGHVSLIKTESKNSLRFYISKNIAFESDFFNYEFINVCPGGRHSFKISNSKIDDFFSYELTPFVLSKLNSFAKKTNTSISFTPYLFFTKKTPMSFGFKLAIDFSKKGNFDKGILKTISEISLFAKNLEDGSSLFLEF